MRPAITGGAYRPRRLIIAYGMVLMVLSVSTATARPPQWQIRDGRFYDADQWVFLKIAKPLYNFADPTAVGQLQAALPTLKAKGYNCLELNCYWHQFDEDGDGELDHDTKPLRELITAISAAGMYPCLSVETYGVGGGTVPEPFWQRHPDTLAVNAEGQQVIDTEYDFKTKVPSIHAPAYVDTARRYIRNLVSQLNHEQLLYFETTVEPQYIGNQWIDYSPHARAAFEAWKQKHGLKAPVWPEHFPIPQSFREDRIWNRFRAEALADWVKGDAAVFRAVAGADSYIAVDYLETCGDEMIKRNGNSQTFLAHLTHIDIIQVNWHFNLTHRQPNACAYRNLAQVRHRLGRTWAITEHMTLNGSDFHPEEVPAILKNTLQRSTLFGWEFVNVVPSSRSTFSLYNDDWSPKPLIAEVDNHWAEMMNEVRAEAQRRAQAASKR